MMNGVQNKKGEDLQKPFPGCMGMMINIFDVSSGLPRNKLLTENPHRDVASPMHRDQPDVVKKKSNDKFGVSKGDQTRNLKIYPSKKSSGTPMKMLIEHEMSSEPQPSQNSSNVVARLMGLDTLPMQQSIPNPRRISQENLHYCTKYKDVHEVWHRPQQNRTQNDSCTEKRMALVHQKFNEAKRLATNENLLQSKEFQDAIEVLSLNRDLFLKFFEEPNAIFSKHFSETQTIQPSSDIRRITVLKPAKMSEIKGESQKRDCLSSNFILHKTENTAQPTRIVVLKPSLGLSQELKVPSISTELEHVEAVNSREIAKEITQKMQEYAKINFKNEGDECSVKEDFDCTSDLESLTPTSRLGSPYSISSFSRASHCSEPFVIREAKKRLSERLAMVASNEINHDQSQMLRSSSTLGEMLAFNGVKANEEDINMSPRDLVRSKSLPISSSNFDIAGSREVVNKEVVKSKISKSGMSFFRGKVSSLFLSRSNKKKDLDQLDNSSKRDNSSLESFHHCPSEENALVDSVEKIGKVSSSTSSNVRQKGGSVSKASFSSEKFSSSDNQDQPSPSSVLEAPFEDDPNNNISHPSTSSSISCHPQALSRSPPIGSISRTLSRDNILKKPLPRVLSRECEEQERFLLVQKLLSHAKISNDKEFSTILAKWYSLDSPLDPMLLDEFLDRKDEEAKCRERRSNQRLTFDCVNAALLMIGLATLVRIYPFSPQDNCQTCYSLNEEVWRIVKDWFSGDNQNRNIMLEKFVKREIAGNGWVESICIEVDEFSREIVENVLEELVEDALVDLTDGCL